MEVCIRPCPRYAGESQYCERGRQGHIAIKVRITYQSVSFGALAQLQLAGGTLPTPRT